MPSVSTAQSRLNLFREHIAPDLVPGDLLLFAGRGFWSSAIQFFSRSPYSHIGVLDYWRKQWCCLEAKERRGVRPIALELLITGYPGVIEWFHIQQPQFNRDKALEYAVACMGLDYSNRQNIRILMGIDADCDPNRFNCSEFARSYLDEGGFVFTEPIPKVPKPGDFSRQSGLDMKARLN